MMLLTNKKRKKKKKSEYIRTGTEAMAYAVLGQENLKN